MHLTYQFFRCPNCKKLLFFRIIKIISFIKGNSGLGPGVICCADCGAVINTNNEEWAAMKLGTKAYFWFLTIIYSFVLGLLMSIVIFSLMDKIRGMPENSSLTTPIILTISILVGLPFVLLQVLRIALSIIRTNKKSNEPYRTSFFNWQINFQSIGLAFIFIWMFLIVAVYFLK